MQAKEAVEKFGELLIGQKIRILQYGESPEFGAKVIELYPAEDDKNIVMGVRNLKKQNCDYITCIYDDEEVEIV